MSTTEWRGNEVEKVLNKEVVDRLIKSVLLIEGEMKRLLKKRGYPPAAPPGQPPATRSGLLGGSPTHAVDPGKFIAQAGTHLPYGFYLEKGTRKMKARPWGIPAFDAMKSKIRKLMGI